jgi:hypothetical protein
MNFVHPELPFTVNEIARAFVAMKRDPAEAKADAERMAQDLQGRPLPEETLKSFSEADDFLNLLASFSDGTALRVAEFRRRNGR